MKLDINLLVRQMAAERDIEAETLVEAVAELCQYVLVLAAEARGPGAGAAAAVAGNRH